MKQTLTYLFIIFLATTFGQTIAQNKHLDSLKQNLHLDRYIVYEYNPKGQLYKEKEFDNKNKQTSYRTTEYDSVGRIKNEKEYECCWKLYAKYENIYNPDSTISKRVSYLGTKMSSYIIYTYDGKKAVLNEFYNAEKKLERVSTAKYNKDNKVINYTFKKADKILFYNDYEYIQNASISTKFNSSSRKIGTTESIYDDNKNLIKRIERDSSNQITQVLEWVYNNNLRHFTMFFNDKNEVVTLSVDNFDTQGKLAKTEWYKKEQD
ncbi:MAG TPA: hypothetical protein VGC65_12355 [Bacteroidia bacterium]|jgi:hypothetical protein